MPNFELAIARVELMLTFTHVVTRLKACQSDCYCANLSWTIWVLFAMAWFDDLAGGFSVSAGAITLATGIYGLSVAAEKVAKPQALAEIGRILTKRAEPFPSAAASWILEAIPAYIRRPSV